MSNDPLGLDIIQRNSVTPEGVPFANDSNIVRGARAGTLGAGSQLQAVTGLVGEAAGADEFAKARYAEAQRLALQAQETAPRITSYKDVNGVRDALDYAGGMVGQSLPYAAIGGAAALATGGGAIPGMLAGATALTPFEAGDIAQRQMLDPAQMQRSAGDRLLDAGLGGAVSAATQAVVPSLVAGKILGRTAKTVAKQGTGKILGRGAADMGLEGVTEGAGEAIKQTAFNPNAALDYDAIAENAVGGLAGGAAMGSIGTGAELLHSNGEQIKGFVGSAAKPLQAGAKSLIGRATGLKETVGEALGPDGYDLGGKTSSFVGSAKDMATKGMDAARAKVEGYDLGQARDDAGAAVDAVTSAFDKARKSTKGMIDRIADSEEFANAKNFVGKQGEALKEAIKIDDEGRLASIRDMAKELWESNMPPERREALKTAMTNLGDRANQAYIASAKKAKDAAAAGRLAVSGFKMGVDRMRAERQADKGDTKKSEDYAGVDKVVKDVIGPFLRERLPHLLEDDFSSMPEAQRNGAREQRNSAINELAPALRGLISEMSADKPVSVDTYMSLLNVAGEHTAEMLDKVHTAMKITDPAKVEAFFSEVNNLVDVQKKHGRLIDTMRESLIDGPDSVHVSDLREAAAEMLKWASTTGPQKDTGSAARQRFRDTRVKDELTKMFGKKADTVLAAVQSMVKQTESRAEKARVKYDEEGNPLGEHGGDALTEVVGGTKLAVYQKKLHLNADDDPGKAGFQPAITQSIDKAQAANPDRKVRYASAEELGMDHPLVKDMHTELVKRGLAADLGLDEAQRYADEEIGKYGAAVSEASNSHLNMTADELDAVRLDTKAHGRSPSRLEVGDLKLDAVKITRAMAERFKEKDRYSPIDELGQRYRAAHMFMEGVAAVQEYQGKAFDIPDATVIAHIGKTPLTWGEARKMDVRTRADKADDRIKVLKDAAEKEGEANVSELKDMGVRLTSDNVRDAYAEARKKYAERIKKLKEIGNRENLGEDPSSAGNERADPTGFEGGVERGLQGPSRKKLAERIAKTGLEIQRLTKAMAADGQGDVADLAPQLSALVDRMERLTAAALKGQTKLEDLGTGQREFDPFGPTFQNGRDLDATGRGPINTDGGEKREGGGAPSLLGPRRRPKDAPASRAAEPDDGPPLSAYDEEGTPSPKVVAAKKAAFLTKARSGDAALIKTLKESTDAKGLQRAVDFLENRHFDAALTESLALKYPELVSTARIASFKLQEGQNADAETADLIAAHLSGSQEESETAMRLLKMLDHTRDQYLALTDEVDAQKAMTARLKANPHSTVGELAKLIAPLLKDEATIAVARAVGTVTPSTTVEQKAHGVANGATGHYAFGTKTRPGFITMFPASNGVHVFLHEAAHAATVAAMEKDAGLHLAFDHLLGHVVKHMPDIGLAYGGTNTMEFIAEGLSNPAFREKMRRIPGSRKVEEFLGTRAANAWEAFVDLMRKALGMDPQERSALAQFLDLSGVAMKTVGRGRLTETGAYVLSDRSVMGREEGKDIVQKMLLPASVAQELIARLGALRGTESERRALYTLDRAIRELSPEQRRALPAQKLFEYVEERALSKPYVAHDTPLPGVTKTLNAINERLGELVKNEDTAYGLGIKKYSLERGEAANDNGRVLSFPDRIGERLQQRFNEIVEQLSQEDFDTLRNDVLARDPDRRKMPSVLKDAFKEWLDDYFGSEREGMMSPERQDETEAQFYEEVADNDGYEPIERAMAQAMLSGAELKALSAQPVDPNAQGPRDLQSVFDYVRKVLGNSVVVDLRANIPHAGEFQRLFTNHGVDDIIRISVHALNPTTVAYHESLHAFFTKLMDGRNGKIAGIVERAASSPVTVMRLRKLLDGQPEAIKQLANAEERAAYMYQFWAAGKLDVAPEPTTIFGKIAEFIRKALGVWSNDERALHVLKYFHSGEFARNMNDPDAVARALLEPGRNAAIEQFKKLAGGIGELGEKLAVAGHQRLRDTGIPALNELADMMKLQGTAEGNDFGFIPAARLEHSLRLSNLGELLHGASNAALRAAMESMQRGNDMAPINALTDRNERAAAMTARATLRQTLDDAHAYMTRAGVDVGDLGVGTDYFPRVWDVHYISSHQREFLNMLERYVQSGDLKGDPRTIMQNLMTSEGTGLRVVDRPGMQHVKPRELAFITADDAARFLNKNLYETMNSYLMQATRRAEWARRFDDDSEKLNDLLDRAGREGATPDDLDSARKYIRSMDGTLGDDIDPTMRRLQGNVIVYQNLRLLPLAIFSSVVDPLGIMVRGGTMPEAFRAFKRGMKEVVKSFQKNPTNDDATDLASILGVIDDASLMRTLGASYTQGMVGERARKMNDLFFRFNLMEQYNRSMRVGATEAAINFLGRHASGKHSAHSARWMAELGFQPDELRLNAQGRPLLSQLDGLTAAQEAKVRAAINRWVDGAVLRPDAADKPIWMSDPRFAFIAHLKQFVFSFQETILKRAVHELKSGNYSPAYALASYVPVMIAADSAKGLLQGGGSEPAWKRDWTAADYVWSGVERAGLLGVGQFAVDVGKGVRRGESGLGELAGPTLEQLGDAVEVAGGRRAFSSFLLRSMPANALYAEALKGEPVEAHHPE